MQKPSPAPVDLDQAARALRRRIEAARRLDSPDPLDEGRAIMQAMLKVIKENPDG